ncbi:phage tail tape measure protein [Neisseriaceae bacterium B1]
MSADLAISIKVGASVGAAMGGLRSLVSGTRDLTQSTTLLQKQYTLLDRAIARAARSGNAFSLHQLKQHQSALADMTRKMHANQQRQNTIATRLEANKTSRENMRAQVVGAVAGLGVLTVPIKAAMDFESSMADVRKVVDFETPQQFKQMEQDLLNMTHKIPMTGKELAAIAASGGQLGIARQDLAKFTETVAKMSVAFDMSAEQTGESMAKLSNIFKIPIKDIGRLGDAINHLSNSSPAKAAHIVDTLGRVGGVAKQFGLTELQTAALSNAFISLGKSPEVAGTAINGMLTKLMTAEKGGKSFQAALKGMGISAKELKANIAKNGEQALMDFLKQVNKLPKDKQMGTLVDLFGLEYADDVALLTGSLETYQKSMDALQSKDGKSPFSGSMDKEFAARSATTANNWQLFKNQMQHLAISIGSVMLPAINGLLNSMKPLVDALIRFSEAHPSLIKNIVLVLTALASFTAASLAIRFGLNLMGSAVLGVNGKIVSLLASFLRVKSAVALLNMGRGATAMRVLGLSAAQGKTALLWLGKATRFAALGWRAMSLAMLANPMTWLVLALAAAALLIYTYWKPIKAFFVGFWDGLRDGIAPIMPLLEMIGAGWKGLFDLAVAFLQPIIDWFKELGLVSDETAQSAQGFGYFFGAMLGSLIGGVTTVGSMIINGWRMIFDTMAQIISTVVTTIQTLFNNALNAIYTRIASWSPVTAFQAAFAAVSGFFSGLVGTFMSYGGMLIDGLVNGIKAKIGNAVAAVQGLATRVKGAFTGSGKGMDIHSPSRVFRAYGGFMTEGLAIGVNKGADKPIGKISQLAGSLKDGFAERMGGFRSNLSARLSANADNLSQARAEHSQAQVNHGGAMTIHFNPTINAAGGDVGQIETALQMGLREFEDLFKRMMADRERRAY